jgi:hypothetical protein
MVNLNSKVPYIYNPSVFNVQELSPISPLDVWVKTSGVKTLKNVSCPVPYIVGS